MPKIINADELLKRLPDDLPYKASVKRVIEQAPPVNAEEIRHGKWVYCGKSSGNDHKWQCSECLRMEYTKHKKDIKDYPYCHCGAKMDGED